ncbi:MAG: alpha-2-macroglobulin family protein, partial [Anaerolineae bacterium]|nr:alpha-2-macroglobulin family protein [Anaerolineae bacterium]
VGYAQLAIDTAEKELTITMKPDKPADQHYQPGETVTYEITTTDSRGRPVEAELALSLVDLSVLSLADQPPDLVGTFWRERGLGVHTASGLTLSVDRINLAVAPEAKGGGGGEGFGVVRRRFPDTAYWNPMVRTDANGKATVQVVLPDNLTTWRLSGWGVTAETLVGQSTVDVVSSKDLLVRPVTPRFLVVNDRIELGAVINNNTDQPLDTEVVIQANGLHLSGDTLQKVTVPARDRVRVAWTAVAANVPQVRLRLGARAADLTDALELSLPVYRYSTPEVVATAGQLEEDGSRQEGVALPARYDPTQGELTVQIDPSLAAGMVKGLKFLEHFPYECTEQTVSRFLPNVMTYRAYKELGLERPDLAEALPRLVNVGLQRLYKQQRYDGGWGWWVADESNPFVTAYVLLGMVEARRAGFVVDEGVMNRAADFLEGALQPVGGDTPFWQANRQAFILYVLAEAGRHHLARAVVLFEHRDMLDAFGKAFLAMALALLQPDDDTRVRTLLSDITSAAIISATGAHWEEAEVDYYAMNTDTRSTAIILAALARLDADNPLATNVVRWLMSVRKEGFWETTQENAWAIIALTDWMRATGELEGRYDWRVWVNDQLLGQGSVTPENLTETQQLQLEVARLLAEGLNRVVIERSAPQGRTSGTGRLYYSMYLRLFKPVEDVKALNRGIIVSRRYTLASCDVTRERCATLERAKVGDVIRVQLTIIAPNDLHYVVVEDPFPAGAEGVDQSLKTTSVVGQAPELRRTDRRNPWGGEYGWWWFSHSEMRDEKAVLFATYLPRGTYEYTYLIRASLPGEFHVVPTHAYEMYFPEVFGRTDGMKFTITP